MQQSLLWTLALIGAALCVLIVLAVAWRVRSSTSKRLPTEWPLVPRPAFTNDERRVYHLLREALPQNVVLFKLQLLRLCRPADSDRLKYWFDLLGSIHVSFVICSVHGRALVAIDLETARGDSQRVLNIKKSVLNACRVRYIRCPIDHLPTISELELLVAMSNTPPAGSPAQMRAPVQQAHQTLATTVASRRRERETLGQDSRFQDSFFGEGPLMDPYGDFAPMPPSAGGREPLSVGGEPPRRDLTKG